MAAGDAVESQAEGFAIDGRRQRTVLGTTAHSTTAGSHTRHNRLFFAGGPGFAGYGYYGYDCWRWAATPWGLRRVWVCGDYGCYDY